ncbi:hypothetical protein HYY71_06915 [Candidatus Woesearchaeota archaeon]|nr:hypothetical protein [Candidatus Woesearchaeota archaeon]
MILRWFILKFGAYLTGAFGQSDALFIARNELSRRGETASTEERRSLAEAVDRQILADTKAVIEAQQTAGLSYVSDPMSKWFSIFHPLTQGVRNVREGPQNPWAKNLFYNWPIIDSPLNQEDVGFTEKFVHLDLLPTGRAAVILPSPYTVLMASDVKGYQDQRSALRDITQLLYNEARDLVKKGVARIQYDEPVIAMKQSRGSLEEADILLLQQAMQYCGKIEGATTSLHTYFGDVGAIIPALRDIPVDCIGVDGTSTSMKDIIAHRWDGKELAVGFLDSQSASMENPDGLADKIKMIMDGATPSRLFLTPNTSTEYLGFTLAMQKLEVLKRAMERLRQHE